MAKSKRDLLVEEIRKECGGDTFTAGEDPELEERMLECALMLVRLNTKYRRPVFDKWLDICINEWLSQTGRKDHEILKSVIRSTFFLLTFDGVTDRDKGYAIDKEPSEILFTVLARTADELTDESMDPADEDAAIITYKMVFNILKSHFEESHELSWWNRFTLESVAERLCSLQRTVWGHVDARDSACEAVSVIEQLPEPEKDEDRKCLLGVLSWYAYQGWKASDERDEKKERRYLRKTVRNLQNIDGNPFEDQEYVKRILDEAMALLG